MGKYTTLIQALIKTGAKALNPVLGDVAEVLMAEGGSALFELAGKPALKPIRDRLLKSLETSMETLVREHSFSPELIDRVYPMVDRITDLYGLDMEDWTKVRFKPEKAATLVMTRMNEMEVEDLHALGGLTAKTLCHGLLTAFYQAMREDDMAMARVEPEFRAALLDGLDRIIHSNEIEVQRQAMGLLSLPLRHWRADTFPPGALLRADTIQTAPFHGREQELTDIKSWCESEQTTAVRLYTGKGGMGKTRLFRRACEILHRKGWRSGFLNRMAGDAGDEHWQYLIDSPQSLFIVVVLAPRSTGNGFGVSAEQTPFSRRLAFFRIFLNVPGEKCLKIVNCDCVWDLAEDFSEVGVGFQTGGFGSFDETVEIG